MNNIHFYHGKLDEGVPILMARALSEKIKDATFTTFEEEGHLSIFFNALDSILDNLKKG